MLQPTCDHHHLASVPVVKAMFTLSRENVGCNLRNILE